MGPASGAVRPDPRSDPCPDPRPRPTSRTRGRLVLPLLCAAAALLGGGPARPPTPGSGEPPSPAALGRAAGCRPEQVTAAAELWEGACRTPRGALRLLRFATAGGQRAWLAEARAYGGTYLVGDRWLVVAQDPGALPGLRDRLGGTFGTGDRHTTPHPADPAESADPIDPIGLAGTDGTAGAGGHAGGHPER
ncbi:hypothetical protein [Streptomyces sp. NPDC097619]|uniref:hypothetical protein n=1 Tax=Streptomyces sp. NPDC097619 TaxID=3157228 RepID=UPI0033278883